MPNQTAGKEIVFSRSSQAPFPCDVAEKCYSHTEWAIVIQNDQIRSPASCLIGHPQTYQLFTLAIGSSSSFRFPEIQDMFIVPIDVILITADP